MYGDSLNPAQLAPVRASRLRSTKPSPAVLVWDCLAPLNHATRCLAYFRAGRIPFGVTEDQSTPPLPHASSCPECRCRSLFGSTDFASGSVVLALHAIARIRERRAQLEGQCTGLLVAVRRLGLRVYGNYVVGYRVIEFRAEVRFKQAFLLLPVIHDSPLDVLQVLQADSVLLLYAHLLRRTDDEEARGHRDVRTSTPPPNSPCARAGGLALPVAAEVGREVLESEPCDDEHRQHFEEKTCREVLTLQIGIEKHDEVDDHRRPCGRKSVRKSAHRGTHISVREGSAAMERRMEAAHADEKYRREHDERRGLVADARGIRVVIIIVSGSVTGFGNA